MRKTIIYTIVVVFMFCGFAIAGPRHHDRGHQKYHKYQKHTPKHFEHGYRYKYHGKRQYRPKHYRGHWRSWHTWENHRRHHYHLYRHGRYYRHNGHLYFSFQTPDGIFTFSIGR